MAHDEEDDELQQITKDEWCIIFGRLLMRFKMKMEITHNAGKLDGYVQKISFGDKGKNKDMEKNTFIFTHYPEVTIIRHECLRKKTMKYAVIDFNKPN